MNATRFLESPLHPYYPQGVEIIGYVKNYYSGPYLVAIFAVGSFFIFFSAGYVTKWCNPKLPTAEARVAMWFVLTGSIHLFFEGYYAYNFRTLGNSDTIFGEMWKEYALSDSRYLTKHSFVLCMETVTAFCWGPLSFLVAYLITRNHPLRHTFQIIVSLGQVYGDLLYYSTCLFDEILHGKVYSRPESYYYWFYFVGINFIWIVLPSYLIYQSSTKISAMAILLAKSEGMELAEILSANGAIPKPKMVTSLEE